MTNPEQSTEVSAGVVPEQARATPLSVYTLLAYRPNGVDTCRGCVMGQSDSDFTAHYFTSADELVNTWARLRLDSLGTPREVCNVEFTLLINGLDENSWWNVFNDAYDRAEVDEPEFHALSDAAETQLEVLRAEKHELELKRQEAQAQVELLAQLAKRRQVAADERAEYERLRSKYGHN